MANIDTLKYYKQLVQGGISDEQAQTQVYALGDITSDLVTKDYLHQELSGLEARIDSKIDRLESKFDAKFGTMRTLGWALFVAILAPTLRSLV